MASPYASLPVDKWIDTTRKLIAEHPLKATDIQAAVLDSWESIFESKIGRHGIQIGKDIFPGPTIMGTFLHELVPLELAAKYPGVWRSNRSKGEKDLVYEPVLKYSIEIKTSSNKNSIFGNRSYAQPQSSSPLAKGKDGYYIAINFEKFAAGVDRPKIRLIRFGWLDHTDWIPQASSSSQQARLAPMTYKTKLLLIYRAE